MKKCIYLTSFPDWGHSNTACFNDQESEQYITDEGNKTWILQDYRNISFITFDKVLPVLV